MKQELIERVGELDEQYFKHRSLLRLVSALCAQTESMKKEPTLANVRKQLGDVLFVSISLARNMQWGLDELLEDVIVKVTNRQNDRHYYEAHVTIEPVFDGRREEFGRICVAHEFRAAELLMKKRKRDTATRSQHDAFATGRSISRSDIEDRMFALVQTLLENNFVVWRYKIESTLLDSRYDDSRSPLQKEKLPEREKNPRAPADGALTGRKPLKKLRTA